MSPQWVRIDSSFPGHRKVLELAPERMNSAVGLYMLAMCFADEHRTDGVIPTRAMRIITATGTWAEDAAELVRVGLWHEAEGGYAIHDYLAWQRSAAEIDARSDAAREMARKRWDATKGRADGNANGIADGNAAGNADKRRVDKKREEQSSPRSPADSLQTDCGLAVDPLDERPEGKAMETTDIPSCLLAPITLTDPAYTGTCIGFIVHAMQEQFGAGPTPSEFAELKAAIVTGCIRDCTGEHAQLCAMQIVGKLRTKGKTSFKTSRLWLKCVREDRMEARQ